MSSSSTLTEHPAFRLRAEIQDHLFRKDEPSKCFITSEKIEEFWPRNLDELRTVLGLKARWSDDDLDLLQQHLKRITCILAWICVGEFEQCLRTLLQLGSQTQNQSNPPIDDASLPLSPSDCTRVLGDAIGQNFYLNQFIFEVNPISSDPEYVQDELPDRRWPFLSDPVPIGSGGYGQVAKVRVVKRYLRAGNMSQDEDEDIAVKRFREEEAWFKEVNSLELLKGSLSSHDHLVLHLAAITKGSELSIFLPYTRYGDLETYLGEGYLPDADDSRPAVELYNFSKAFPRADLTEMLREFAKIMNAVEFLHKRVSLKGGQRVFCAHVDLRPQNILVFPPDENHPAGFWKISDFGISSFKLEDGKSVPDPARGEHPAIGDIIERIRSRSDSRSTTLPVLMGSHRAPEISLSHFSHDPRASDIWALACILVELIVFGTGLENSPKDRQDRLRKFRAQRASYQLEQDSTDDSFFDRKSYDTTSGLRLVFSVRRKVNEWLDRVGKEGRCHAVVGTTRAMLHPDPLKRLDARGSSQQILQHCEGRNTNGDTDYAAREKAIWQVQVRNQGGRLEYIGTPDEEEPISHKEEPTSQDAAADPVMKIETSMSASRLGVNTPEETWPESLKIRKFRTYESSEYQSNLVRTSSSGKLAAYLVQSTSQSVPYVVRYRTRNDLHVDDGSLMVKSNRTVTLPENADWTFISVGENRAVLRGAYSGRSIKHHTAVCAVDLRSKSCSHLPLDDEHVETLTHVTASGNLIAVASDEMIWLWTSDGTITQCPGPEQNPTLVDVAMSNDAQFLFSWWDNGSNNIVQIWNISDRQRPDPSVTTTFKKVGGRPETRFIVPCGNLPACIMYDDRGMIATAVTTDNGETSCQVEPQPEIAKSAFPRSAALCATSNHLLAFVDRHSKLYVHRLILQKNEILMIESKPLMEESSLKVKDVESIALERLSETMNYSLRIYNSRGDVSVLTLEAE